MNSRFPDCEIALSLPQKVLREQASEFRVVNPERREFTVLTVDGCAIKEGLRCDYMIFVNENEEIYVELKGHDIDHAVKQITATITALSRNPSSLSKLCFVISTRCPLTTAKIQNIKKKFKSNFNSIFTIKNRTYSHHI